MRLVYGRKREKKSRFFPFTGKPCNCSARFKSEALLSGSFPSHVGVVCPPLWLTHRVLSLSEDLFDVAIPKRGGAPLFLFLFLLCSLFRYAPFFFFLLLLPFEKFPYLKGSFLLSSPFPSISLTILPLPKGPRRAGASDSV